MVTGALGPTHRRLHIVNIQDPYTHIYIYIYIYIIVYIYVYIHNDVSYIKKEKPKYVLHTVKVIISNKI